MFRGSQGAAAAFVAAAAALGAPAPGQAVGQGPTHSVSLVVTVTDHWTRTSDSACGASGSGTVMFRITWRRPARAHPEINGAGGRWVILVLGPGGHSALDLGPQRIKGTISYSDQTQLPAGCTGTIDKSGCHTYAATGTSNVFGVSRRDLQVLSPLRIGSQLHPPGSCHTGDYQFLNDDSLFRRTLSIRMPSPKALHSKRIVVVRGSNTADVTGLGDDNATTVEDQVTQSAVVTFTRL